MMEVSRLLAVIDPEEEPPLKLESGALLRIIAEFTWPIREFVTEPGPSRLLHAISGHQSEVAFIDETFGLLSRLANAAPVRSRKKVDKNGKNILNETFDF
jgi:hypothetical protein